MCAGIEQRVKSKLRHIRELFGMRDRLAAFEREHTSPLLTNMSMIRNIYDIYKGALRRIDPSADPRDTINRKKFLFVVLYLYSPETLCGSIIKHRLRENFSSVLQCAPTSVSRDCADARVYYDNYPDFRHDVNTILSDVVDSLFGTDKNAQL